MSDVAVSTRSGAHAELLLLGAVTIAGGLAGVLVQVGVEVARDRRDSREQLQAAGAQLDELDADLTDARLSLESYRERQQRYMLAERAATERAEAAEQAAAEARKEADAARARLDLIWRAGKRIEAGDRSPNLGAVILRASCPRPDEASEPADDERLPAPDDLNAYTWQPEPADDERGGE